MSTQQPFNGVGLGYADTINSAAPGQVALSGIDCGNGVRAGTKCFVAATLTYWTLTISAAVPNHLTIEAALNFPAMRWIQDTAGGGDVASVNGAIGALTITTNPLMPVTTVGTNIDINQNIAADWPLGICRVYAIDSSRPDDSGAGFADPATSSTADYAIACAAAGAVAKKTWAGLLAIFPKNLNGRLVEIVVAAGTYAEVPAVISQWVGNAPNCAVRGTVTDATSGVTKFDGSAADCTAAGHVTAAGMNAAGYNPTGAATTTSVPCLQVGGAAPGFAAEPARPLGTRMRFDAATVTVALRGICREVIQVVGGNTLTPGTALPAAPAATDVFYLEEGGVVTSAATLIGAPWGSQQIQMIGIRSAGTFTFRDGGWLLAGCTFAAMNEVGTDIWISSSTYSHPVRGTLTVGGGVRSDGAVVHQSSRELRLGGSVYATTVAFQVGSFLSPATTVPWVFGGVVTSASSFWTAAAAVNSLGSNIALVTPCRILARATLGGTDLGIGNLSLNGAGALPAISIQGSTRISITSLVSGLTGNNDVGLDLTGASGSSVIIRTLPTLTGALGDVRLAGGAIVTWASLLLSGITDIQGNRIITATGQTPLWALAFSGVLLGGAAQVIAYLANGGFVGGVNQIIPFAYPTNLRIFSRLRVNMVANTATTAITVTLYKNGVATAMSVTFAPGAVGVQSDLINAVLFLDGDTKDLRVSNTGADAGAVSQLSVTLAGPS